MSELAGSVAKDQSIKPFVILISGQLLSFFGTTFVGFAVGVWVFQQTGSVIDLAVLSMLALLPAIFISPIAGVIADRWPKKPAMIAVDALAAVVSLGVLILLLNDQLEIWHLYITAVVDGIAIGMQRPLYESTTPMMVPKHRLASVNGTTQAIAGISQLVAPALAGALLIWVGLKWIILIDLATFLIALVCILSVKVPRLQRDDSDETASHWVQEFKEGWQFVSERLGLKALFWFVTLRNFLFASCEIIALPLLLTLTTADKAGLVLSFGGLGVAVGGGLIALTGSTKSKINFVFIAQAMTGCAMIMAGLTTDLWLLAIAVGIAFMALPIEDATSTTIMQNKVPLKLLGRVGSVRNMLTLSAVPVAMLVAAPLAEYVFEPMMMEGGVLAAHLGGVMGTGTGRGMALLLVLMGSLTLVLTVLGFCYKPLRNMERDLPDHLHEQLDDSATVTP